MKICIIRNAECRTNAAIFRILDALLFSGKKCILLTRSRFNNEKGVIKKEHHQDNQIIDNYEINIKAEMGRGILNISQLISYQFIVLKWLFFNRNKFDIIHSFDLDSGLPVFFVSKIIHKKYVYHIADFYVDSRGGIPNILKKIVRKLEYIVIANAETTIICTEERREQIKGSNPKNLVVIHNVPSLKTNISKQSLKNDDIHNRKITFAYVGGLTEKRFIKSIVDVFKQNNKFRLELAGMGDLNSYVEHASQKYENIEYHGMVNYEKALDIYSKCDVMFAIYDPYVPNHRYSAPNKVYEAMMFGKPIIVAKNTSVDKLVEKEKIGFVIDYTKEDFINVLSIITEDKSVLEKYGKNASEAYSKYSWKEMRNKLIDVYNNIH